jgi:hypothetical protein
MSTRGLKGGAGLLVALALCLLPRVAHACPVCFAAKNDASRVAFIVTTGFLTALPLVVLGGLIYWVFRRSRALEQQERADELASATHQPVDR